MNKIIDLLFPIFKMIVSAFETLKPFFITIIRDTFLSIFIITIFAFVVIVVGCIVVFSFFPYDGLIVVRIIAIILFLSMVGNFIRNFE